MTYELDLKLSYGHLNLQSTCSKNSHAIDIVVTWIMNY